MPMGLRIRLKASFNIDTYLAARLTDYGYSAEHVAAWKRVLTAMKNYGMILCDRGGNMYCQGTMDSRWDIGVVRKVYTGMFIQSNFDVIRRGWNNQGGGFTSKEREITTEE